LGTSGNIAMTFDEPLFSHRDFSMPQKLRALDPTLSARDRFGAALRRWRQLRALSQARLAMSVPVSPDQIAKLEKAQRWPSRGTAERLDEILGSSGELVALWADGEVERTVAPNGRVPADPSYITHWTQMLSVLVAAGNAVGAGGLLEIVSTEASVISRFGAAATGQVAIGYLGTHAKWLEFGSWIADNHHEQVRATAWLKQASELAGRTCDSALSSYILMRRAQRAYEGGQPRASLDLAESAALSLQPPRIRALLSTRAAQAHAALGNRPAMRRCLKQALKDAAADTSSDAIDLELAPHGTFNYVVAHEGICLLTLGEPDGAARLLESVLQNWPASQRLDEGLFRAQLAQAQVAAGAFDEGVDQARQALKLGLETGSQRILRIVDGIVARNLGGAAGFQDLVSQWTLAGSQ